VLSCSYVVKRREVRKKKTLFCLLFSQVLEDDVIGVGTLSLSVLCLSACNSACKCYNLVKIYFMFPFSICLV
jgi:hypothetical protein